MERTAGTLERAERRLLEQLAAFQRLTGEEGGTAQSRLEAELGPERAQLLVRELTRRPGPPGELSPATSA